MTRRYLYLPGCATQPGASASHYQRSIDTLCSMLDLEFETIPDWNCCGASLAHAAAGELPGLALSARNLALAERIRPGQDVVIARSGCWSVTRDAAHRLETDGELMSETNQALAEAGLKYEAKQRIRHFIEVLLDDVGEDTLRDQVRRPLHGLRVAGHVGCHADFFHPRSHGSPRSLDGLIHIVGADTVGRFNGVEACCGPLPALLDPNTNNAKADAILTGARDADAQVIVTCCDSCQLALELQQHPSAATDDGDPTQPHPIPVLLYSQLLAIALGASASDAGLNGNLIPATELLAETQG